MHLPEHHRRRRCRLRRNRPLLLCLEQRGPQPGRWHEDPEIEAGARERRVVAVDVLAGAVVAAEAVVPVDDLSLEHAATPRPTMVSSASSLRPEWFGRIKSSLGVVGGPVGQRRGDGGGQECVRRCYIWVITPKRVRPVKLHGEVSRFPQRFVKVRAAW